MKSRKKQTRGALLKYMIEKSGVSQNEIANVFGINERTWYNWKNYPDRHITIGRLAVLCEILRLSDQEILALVRETQKYLFDEIK